MGKTLCSNIPPKVLCNRQNQQQCMMSFASEKIFLCKLPGCTFNVKNNPQVYTTQEGIGEIKNNPQQVYTTQEGMQETKNNPQVYTTQEGIEEIKNNPQVFTTQEGMQEIKNNPQIYTT